MTAPDPVAADSSRDDRLARLLDDLTRQLRAGQQPDIDDVARQHPDLADELRQLWGTIQFAEEMAPGRNDGLAAPAASARPCQQVTEPHAPPPASLGPRNFGDYTLLEELGRGGMGVVYKAHHVSLKRTVALKVMLRGGLASPDELRRFRAEASAAARLDHPHILPVYEVGECDGQPYFSMKFIDGTTLAGLAARGPLSSREAARYLAPLCRAIHYAHQQGILHRDLKPANVLIDHDGQPYVTDFGLARAVEEDGPRLTRSGVVLGTPSYMSPEQAFGDQGLVGPATDIYALGAILYELLTGRPPFRAATNADTLLLVREQEPVPPRVFNPRVDADLELICLQCLQKQPGLRYASAGQLADDLGAYLEGGRPSVRTTTLTYYVSKMMRDTHHASVLENWGLLWMWHSLKIFLLCLLTSVMSWCGVSSHWPYVLLWSVGLVVWGAIFWALRRRGGPVMFVERQIAHVWGAAVIATIGVFIVEVLLDRPVLTLSPLLAIIAGMVFVIKGGMLSGSFYVSAVLLFLAAVAMAVLQQAGPALFPLSPLLFGLVSAWAFFFPGLKYYRQRLRSQRLAS
jgi:eukaryotic-like serine/threonine-protein kinase